LFLKLVAVRREVSDSGPLIQLTLSDVNMCQFAPTQKSRYVSFCHTITERPILDSREHARCSVMILNFNYTRQLLSVTGN